MTGGLRAIAAACEALVPSPRVWVNFVKVVYRGVCHSFWGRSTTSEERVRIYYIPKEHGHILPRVGDSCTEYDSTPLGVAVFSGEVSSVEILRGSVAFSHYVVVNSGVDVG